MRRLSRRDFLLRAVLGLTATPVLLSSACAAPTPSAPPKTSDTPAPASTKAPAAQPAATQAPAAATKPSGTGAESRIPKTLLSDKFEGPELVLDKAKYPTEFKEAPQLAELVKAGKLPPVKERLGEDPLVIQPVYEIGKYGGTLKRGFTGPGDVIGGYRFASGPDLPLYRSRDMKSVVPNICKGYELSADGKTTTLFLRKGMKWSDGTPLTADDWVFWFEDIYNNPDIVPTPDARTSIGGKEGKLTKVDDFTVRWTFETPYPYFPHVMSLFNRLSSFAQNGLFGTSAPAPKHYLKQYLPKYSSKEALDKQAKELKYDNWLALFKFKTDWSLNPDLPAITPWKTVIPCNQPNWTMERNPYSIWVDSAGNQLPYADKVVFSLAENLEVVNMRAIAGEYDMQCRHIDTAKIPVLLENQQKGGYTVSLNPGQWGGECVYFINLNYDADMEINKWLNNVDFRRALALGIDRDQINEAFFLGLGRPGNPAPADDNPYSPGPEYKKLWGVLDVKKANEMLDKIGLTQKDAQGYRQRTDGKGRLRLTVVCPAGAIVNYAQVSEMVKQHWTKIGIDLEVQEVERSLGTKKKEANECQLFTWLNDNSDDIINEPFAIFPSRRDAYMPHYGDWFASGGKKGKEPPPEMKEIMEMWDKAMGLPYAETVKMAKEIWKKNLDQVWGIGTVGESGQQGGVIVTKTNLGNVPKRWYHLLRTFTPAIIRPQTFYFKS